MPLINVECPNGHRSEQYLHTWAYLGVRLKFCDACGWSMAPIFSPGTTLTHFRENRESVIHNLDIGNGPVRVTSHKEHQDAMKAAGVEQGQPNWMRGRPGYRPI